MVIIDGIHQTRHDIDDVCHIKTEDNINSDDVDDVCRIDVCYYVCQIENRKLILKEL